MKRILFACLVSFSLIGAGPILRGAEGDAPAAAPAKGEKKMKQMPFRGKVTQVDKAAKTLTLAGKEKPRVFKLTADTRIHNDGQPAVLEDVRTGAMVGGRARATESGEWEVIVLNLGIKAAKAAEGEKKEEVME